MKLKYLLSVAVVALVALALPSCSDDTTPTYTWHPEFGNISSESTTMVTVESEPKPKSGQKHRSSSNFNTTQLKGGKYLLWTTDDPNVTFSVKRDVSGGSDGTFQSNLHNGAITEWNTYEKCYIADPKNATDKFNVTVTAVDSGEDYIYVNAAQTHMEGQSHRASQDFDLEENKYGHYKVVCPEQGVSFKIMHNIEIASDPVVYEKVTAGDIIPATTTGKLYIADVTGASGPFTVTFVPMTDMETANWMTQLPDYKYLYQLSIPGTHDSGTFTFDSGLSKCQNFSFDRQLLDGIRFLDIRLNEDLRIIHGTSKTPNYFSDLMTVCNTFLKQNPGETILMSVKAEKGDISDEFYDYVNSNRSSDTGNGTARIVTGGAVPMLGDVRGKIVLFRRFKNPTSGSYGIDCYSYWPKDGTGETEIDGGKLYIEDRYYDIGEAIHDTQEKKEAVGDAMKLAADQSKHDYESTMFLIFNSVAGRVTHTPWEYAWGDGEDGIFNVDPTMSKALSDNLAEVEPFGHPVRVGVVLMDFYNKHGNDDDYYNVQRIINLNFTYNYVPVSK